MKYSLQLKKIPQTSKLNENDHQINSFTSNLQYADLTTVKSQLQYMINLEQLYRMKSY